jgi:hypothetical protein
MSTSSPVSARASAGVFAGIALIAFVEILPQLNKTIWRDEGAALYSAHLGWRALWQQSQVVDRVLLPYYAFLHLWLAVSNSIEWARLPSLVAFGLTVFMVGRLGERLGGLWCGVIGAVVCGTSPLMIEAALDARPYALATLAATVSVVALMRWYAGEGARWIWLFSLAAIVVVALQIFLVVAPLVVVAVAFALHPQRFLHQWRKLVIPLGLLLVAFAWFASLVVGQKSQIALIGETSIRKLSENLVGPASEGPSVFGEPGYAEILLVVIVAVLVLFVLKWRKGKTEFPRAVLDAFWLCVAWAVIPTVLLVALTFAKLAYVDRYVTASVPGMAIAIALLTTRALQGRRRNRGEARVSLYGVTLVGLVVLLGFTAVVSSREFEENLKGAAQYLQSRSGPDEIALPDHSLTESIEYYLSPKQANARLWPENPSERYMERLDLLVGPRVLDDAANNVWLVNDGSAQGTQAFVSSLQRDGFDLVGSRSFDGILPLQVQHFRR